MVWILSTQNAEEGGENGYVRLERNGTVGNLTVHYELDSRNEYGANQNGWAENGVDFSWLPGTDRYTNRGFVTFADGSSTVDIPIVTIDDDRVEPTKTVLITISEAYAEYDVVAGAGSATISIFDNDVAPAVWIDSIQNAIEGQKDGRIRLRRSASTHELTVGFRIGQNSSATFEVDYGLLTPFDVNSMRGEISAPNTRTSCFISSTMTWRRMTRESNSFFFPLPTNSLILFRNRTRRRSL